MPRDRDVAAFAERAVVRSLGRLAGRPAGMRPGYGAGRPPGPVGQFSPLYLPTLIGSRRGKARTRRRASRLLARAGFRSPEWHAPYAVIIGAVTASK